MKQNIVNNTQTRQNYLIEQLELKPHIEGGWFKETFASDTLIDGRTIATSIYFLLSETNFSAFHQLQQDELWYFHEGSPLTIAMINPQGQFEEVHLSNEISEGHVPYYCVKKGTIFGSYVSTNFALVSCLVTPGFTYQDFKLFNRQSLLVDYPSYESIIKRLTRD